MKMLALISALLLSACGASAQSPYALALPTGLSVNTPATLSAAINSLGSAKVDYPLTLTNANLAGLSPTLSGLSVSNAASGGTVSSSVRNSDPSGYGIAASYLYAGLGASPLAGMSFNTLGLPELDVFGDTNVFNINIVPAGSGSSVTLSPASTTVLTALSTGVTVTTLKATTALIAAGAPPSSSSSSCTKGQIALTSTGAHLQVCTATNTWGSVAIGAFTTP